MKFVESRSYFSGVAAAGTLLLLVLGCDAWVRLSGKVISEDGKPVAGAKVIVYQGTSKVTEELTAEDGTFRVFENIAPGPLGSGTIKVVVTKDGYQAHEFSFNWKTDNSNAIQKPRTVLLKKQVGP